MDAYVLLQSNEEATSQMSRVIKQAAKEMIAANKLITYREKEVSQPVRTVVCPSSAGPDLWCLRSVCARACCRAAEAPGAEW